MKHLRPAVRQKRRHAHTGNTAIKAARPQADENFPGEVDTDLDELVIDEDDFDADAVALVTDVQRMHFDREGVAG